MIKRYTFPYSFIVSLILVVSAISQGTVATRTGQKPAGDVPSAKPVTGETIEGDVAEALAIIESNYVSGKKIDYNIVVKSSIDGMLHSLDPHSNYFDAKEFEQFRTDQSSRYFGIGATIGDLSDPEGNVIATYIRATFDGAPAHRAGLRYGDKIVEINGASVLGKSYVDVRNLLRGPRGTVAKLIIERHGTGKREPVEIIRAAVSQPSIQEAYMIRPGVGYISMTGGFNQTTYAEFVEVMRSLKARGMQQLVLDLKNNGGGLVREAYRVANTFLSRGQLIFTQKGRLDGVTEPYYADNANPETMPLVVLLNRNSASASEILAGALQDHDRALIVGETSFGKGLVQNPFVLDYGSMLLLTIAKYETPSGRVIQRDYSDGNLYNYYTGGGSYRDEEKPTAPNGPATKTDGGRTVYSGGGIRPDVEIKADTIPIEQSKFRQRLIDPIFAFSLDVVYGKLAVEPTYKVDKPINFSHDLTPSDFQITDSLYKAFRDFATKKYKFTPAQVDKERSFVETYLRLEFVTAAFGSTTSLQILTQTDNQVTRAITLLPQAEALSRKSAKARIVGSSIRSN